MMGKRNLRSLSLAVFGWMLVALGPLADGQQQAFMVIAHSTLDESSLPKEGLSDYFLKKKTKWPDGSEIHPVDLNIRDVREAFSKEVHKRSFSAIKKYWQRQIFTGRGTPPLEKASVADVLDYVSSTPGAIGYLPSGTRLPAGDLVKVIELR